MAAAYDLDETAVSFITGSGESTNKVESIVADAEELRAEAMEAHSGGAFAGATRGPDTENDDPAASDPDHDRTADGEPTDSGVGNDSDAGDDDSDTGADASDDSDDEDQAGLNDFM